MTEIDPDHLIAALNMQPILQEGAWFVPGPRNPHLSSITVLLTDAPDGFSALHRLDIDEGWQWLDGSPVDLLQLNDPRPDDARPDDARPADEAGSDPLGPRAATGRRGHLIRLDRTNRQVLVPRGTWQGARPLGRWSLVACWCAPAFDDRHFTIGARENLAGRFPEFADEIAALTRSAGTADLPRPANPIPPMIPARPANPTPPVKAMNPTPPANQAQSENPTPPAFGARPALSTRTEVPS